MKRRAQIRKWSGWGALGLVIIHIIYSMGE